MLLNISAQNTLILKITLHVSLRGNEQVKPQASCHDTQQGSNQRL